ncbi:MAG: FAD-dependent thymidylate synthase [Bacilli bacterium]|nr:FAD-dependent thymidylate synthase [Bacilli bacterium]
MSKIKIDLLPNLYLKEDETFDMDKVLNLSGKIAGVCYDKEGFKHLENEPIEKTNRRVAMTLNNGHHSVYGHTHISFNIQNIPKILAMVLNNENEYNTSEKSARYTEVKRGNDSVITEIEEELYIKWIDILKVKIKNEYQEVFSDSKITKLAQENARYFVTVFMPTQMIYTTSLRQINYLASFMLDYAKNANYSREFDSKLADSMLDFVFELERLGVLNDKLMTNDKNRKLSLFGKNLDKKEIHFGDTYSTVYKGSFAYLAQAHRHRTLDYQMEITEDKEYFVPPIIIDSEALTSEWLSDMERVSNITPQGELINIYETGTFDNFILKCKERLCSAAQLEIMRQTRKTLEDYYNNLSEQASITKEDITPYMKGARCSFPDFKCREDCGFKEGKILVRKI